MTVFDLIKALFEAVDGDEEMAKKTTVKIYDVSELGDDLQILNIIKDDNTVDIQLV